MSEVGDRRALDKTDQMIARAKRRVKEERSAVEELEQSGRDAALARRMLAALQHWFCLLVQRRSILWGWINRRW